ncbi:preQ(1) synthase [Candidatus Margulisiibacteriota bacterium]
MAQAEGKIFKFNGPENIQPDLLETFPFDGTEQTIEIVTEEFSAVCPFSGLPDLAKLIIKYSPKGKCIELKSLKYYIISFRNVGIYQEAATDRIYQDLKKILGPKQLMVRTIYNIRGGIGVTSTVGQDF